MKIIDVDGIYYLDEQSGRVALTFDDLRLFKLLTPMGRKMRLRHRAVEKIVRDRNDPEAKLIIALSQLPAREWRFPVPD